MALLRRTRTCNEAHFTRRAHFVLKYDLSAVESREEADEREIAEILDDRTFCWSWPFSEDGLAHGMYGRDQLVVCLPFNRGGTGESSGTTRRFECIRDLSFSWSMGLSKDDQLGSTCFWRLEIEVQKAFNSIVIMASRDISRWGSNTKRLKRVRKVYRLPSYYDVRTTTTVLYDWAVILTTQAAPRRKLTSPI